MASREEEGEGVMNDKTELSRPYLCAHRPFVDKVED